MPLTLNGPPNIKDKWKTQTVTQKHPYTNRRICQNQIIFVIMESLHHCGILKQLPQHLKRLLIHLIELLHQFVLQRYTGPKWSTLPPHVHHSDYKWPKLFFIKTRWKYSDGLVIWGLCLDVPAVWWPQHCDFMASGVKLLDEDFHVDPVASVHRAHQDFPSVYQV